jgi:hypothetical protein
MPSHLGLARTALRVFLAGTVAALAASAGAWAQAPRKQLMAKPPMPWNPSATKAAVLECRAKLGASGGKVGSVTALFNARIANRIPELFPPAGVKLVREKDLRIFTAKVQGAGLIDLYNPIYYCFFEDTGGSFRFIQTCWMSSGRFQSCDFTWLVGDGPRRK